MSIASTSGCGQFSSDRSIKNYAENIWGIEPCERPGPMVIDTGALAVSMGSTMSSFTASASPLDVISPLSQEIALERLSPSDVMKIRSFSPSGTSPFF